MGVRGSMSQLIARTRFMIADPAGGSQHFADQDIQDTLDSVRDDVWYELLAPALTIVNSAGTGNTVGTIWADYYSRFQWWETDVALQGNNTGTSQSWVVLTPVASDYITGHWQFELNNFTTATVPGQFPPVFITGKTYDLNAAAAELCDYWASTYQTAFDFTSDGQSFKRSQAVNQLRESAKAYRKRARVRSARAYRSDFPTPSYTKSVPILGDVDGDWTKP
jgi:hypothetical protein